MLAKRGTIVGLLFGSLMLLQMPAWAQTADGQNPDVAELKEALAEKDRELKALKERVERLEQQKGMRPEPAVSVLAAAQAPAAQPPAQEETFADRLKRLEETFEKTPLFQFLKAIQFTGYVTTTYNYNLSGATEAGTPADRRNDFRYFDSEAKQFTFNMAELQFLKPSTEDSRFGFGLTFNIGSDARKIHAAGLGADNPLEFTNQAFDLRQAYVTYKIPLGKGLDVKGGKFDTLIGLEVVPAPANVNLSRSLLFSWSPPFTHVGFLLSYPFTDWMTATAGVVNGWDVADDNNRAKSFIGQVSLTPVKNVTLVLNAIGGPEQGSFGVPPSNSNHRWLLDFVLIFTPIEKLTLYLSGDLGAEDDALGPGVDAEWWGIEGIVAYQLTDKLSVAVRGEFFRDDDGAKAFTDFVGGVAFAQNLWEVTGTLKYQFTDHFYTRLEYRHDQSNVRSFRGTGALDGGKTQDTLAVEVAYIF